jgi:hypothetical protein
MRPRRPNGGANNKTDISLDRLMDMVREEVREGLFGEQPASPEDVAEVMTQLLAYNIAIERVLSGAAGRSGTLPGHSVSVRGYVSQALSGEARDASFQRLAKYFRDAIVFLMKTHSGIQSAIDQFAGSLVEALRPSRIEERVRPSGMQNFFGVKEVAFWREYRRQFSSLDASGVRQLVQDEEKQELREQM